MQVGEEAKTHSCSGTLRVKGEDVFGLEIFSTNKQSLYQHFIWHTLNYAEHNRPFYSWVLSYLAMNASEAGGDLALIQTSVLFSRKCQLVSIRKT